MSSDPPDSAGASTDEQYRDPVSLELSTLLSEGLDGLLSRTGAQLFGLLLLVGAVSTVVGQTLFSAWIDLAIEQAADPEVIDFLEELGPFPLAVDMPGPLLAALVVLLPFVAEAIRIAAVRAFAAGELDGLPRSLATRRILRATILGWLGGVLLLVGVSLGLVLLIVPGIFIAVTAMFYRQEVAVADKGILDALAGTWNLTQGNRWQLLGLLAVLWLIGLAIEMVGMFVPVGSLTGALIRVVVSPVTTLFSAAVVTTAYVRLRNAQPNTDLDGL